MNEVMVVETDLKEKVQKILELHENIKKNWVTILDDAIEIGRVLTE